MTFGCPAASGTAHEHLHCGRAAFWASVTGSPVSSRAPTAAAILLLGDAGRSTLPALPQLSEIWQHKIPEHRRQGKAGQQPVEDCLCGWLVEGVEGLPECAGQLTRRRRGSVRPGGPAGIRPGRAAGPEHRSRRLSG